MAYDEDYYRNSCAGYAEWTKSGGREFGGIYAYVFGRLALSPGDVLVDIGTGRGELPVVAARAGVTAVGIEYSEAAVELAQATATLSGVGALARTVLADARALPLDDGHADAATMLDVVEHLTPSELDRALAEAHRVLRPGGRLLIHTMPNRTIYEVTYRVQRLLVPWRWRWPADPRGDLERLMHVNEQTLTSLRVALKRAGFGDISVELGKWVYTGHVPSERASKTYHRLARLGGPFARLGVGDLLADARRPQR